MTAIAGLWRFDGNPDARAGCERMLAAQAIYGPHDGAAWDDGAVALGRRLYRALPEDIHDRQPLATRDGRLTLVADVRLDNRDELARALGLAAGEAAGRCDAAILLESLDRWGEDALPRLAGDFAFALWDARAQALLLARDFLGQRPLHYHRGKTFFAFASMPRGLHALAEIPRAPDVQAVAEFVALLPRHGARSFFEGIERVEAGCVVRVTRDGVSARTHWNPSRSARGGAGDPVEGLRHHLDEAVRARLRGAAGSVGTHLSAGFDSAAVTATAARLLAPEGGKLVAFTAVPREGYDGPAPRGALTDEGPRAAATAARYANVEHVLVRAGSTSPLAAFERAFELFDRPLISPCNWVWNEAIHEDARRRGIGVMLTGQMGNMTISYDGIALLPELLRKGRLVALGRTARQLLANRQLRRLGLLAETFGPFAPQWLWRTAMKLRGGEPQLHDFSAIRTERVAGHRLAALSRERGFDLAHRPRIDGFDLRLWVLRRVDIGEFNTGYRAGWGIDSRDPTADKRLVEYALTVPPEEHLAGGMRRSLARRALGDRVPAAVLGEARRGHQSVDWHEGLTAGRGEAAAELDRIAACAPAARLLDVERMRGLIEDWPSGRWAEGEVIYSHRMVLLRGLAVGHFLRRALGANG